MNVLLTPVYGHNGTAVAYMLAEVAVTFSMFILGRKYIPIQFFKKEHLHYIIGSVVMGIGLYFISNSQLDNIMMLTFMLLVGGLTYVGILVVLKDSVSKIIQKTISQYFEKKKIL